MKKNFYQGEFVVFEGLDGSGQSTQVGLLADFLQSRGKQVLKTKEPTMDSEAGKKIRRVLDHKETISAKELQDLYIDDRRQHLEKVIIPALKQGEVVISDRYFFSTFAYGAAGGLDLDELIKLNSNFLLPDLVFFLDAKPETCMQRIEGRGEEKTLFEKKEQLEKVYQNYKKSFQRFENLTKIYFIDGQRSINQVFEQIKKYV